jgi:hypothetical protein
MNRLLIGICLVLLAAAGFSEYRRMQSQKALAECRESVAYALRQAEAQARERERAMTAQTEKVANEASKREQVLAYRAAAVERVNRGLRDEVARLNARPAPENPESASYANEARAARELLGACADEYRAVATDADRLRDQVTGLQQYVEGVLSN